MSTMKKLLAVLLALVMIVAMAAACNGSGDSGTTTGPNSTGGGNTSNPPTTEPGDQFDPFTGHKLGHFEDDGKTYTARSATTQLPSSWNPHTWETSESGDVISNTGDALYTYEFSEDFTTFLIVPSMASDYAKDVTSQYVGKYGIQEGDKNKAWSIPLKEGLCFDNGDPITAQTFVDSVKLLLNPDAQNGRADDLYMGTFKPYNAEQYLKQGYFAEDGEMISAAMGDDEYVDPALFTTDADGNYEYNGKGIIMNVNNSGNWGSGSPWVGDDGVGADAIANPEPWEKLTAAASKVGVVRLNAELLKAFQDVIAQLHGYENVEAYAADAGDYAYQEFEEAAYYGKLYPALDFSEVGFFAPSDTELVIVIKDPMEDGYYLRSALATDFFLVDPVLYEKCADTSTGVYTNTYGTSVDTYTGCGPYMLTEFVEGSYALYTRNPKWHGYRDGEYLDGTYMTDAYRLQLIDGEAATATMYEMFLKGEIDGFGLSGDYVNDYISSEYTVHTDSESTWLLVMNPDKANFERTQAVAEPLLSKDNKVNKTVMTLPDFRKALSYAIDRQEFILNTVATMKPAAYIISKVCVADPDTMKTYRSYDEAKDAILSFWGLSDAWGEGKEYADRDEAIDSITGYDPEGAKALFDAAYDEAVAQGLISAEDIASGKWEVQVLAGIPNESKVYQNGAEYLQTAWNNAVKGTKFEGHFSVRISEPLGAQTWSKELKNNGNVDLLFLVGWGGSAMDPYGLFGCTVDPDLQYDVFTNKNTIYYDVELDGKTLRASYFDWIHNCLGGETISAQVIGADGNPTGETVDVSAGENDPVERRVKIMAAGEEAVLNLADLFPLCSDATASLRSMRIEYVTYDYNLMMGFGGREWNKFLMDDAEWEKYVADQGGTLNYK